MGPHTNENPDENIIKSPTTTPWPWREKLCAVTSQAYLRGWNSQMPELETTHWSHCIWKTGKTLEILRRNLGKCSSNIKDLETVVEDPKWGGGGQVILTELGWGVEGGPEVCSGRGCIFFANFKKSISNNFFYPAGDSGRVLFLTRFFFLSFFLILPAQPQDLVSYSLSCRRSRRILFSSRFFFTLPVTPAGSCFSLVSSFFTHPFAKRMCPVSLAFFFLSSSFCQQSISHEPLNRFWWNLVTIHIEQVRIYDMTFDPVTAP